MRIIHEKREIREIRDEFRWGVGGNIDRNGQHMNSRKFVRVERYRVIFLPWIQHTGVHCNVDISCTIRLQIIIVR